MNNIHEKDWASDCWSGHTGMDSFDNYCSIDEAADKVTKETPTATTEKDGTKKKEATESL